jgi:putative ABC transport system permease protein
MKYLNIAARNLSRQKKRSLLLGFAIAFGVMIITLVNGFTTGALNNIKENFFLPAGGSHLHRRGNQTGRRRGHRRIPG